jgi:DNA modification methylase
MGSGTTAVVAAGLGRYFIGIEKSAQYCESALKRLERNKVHPEIAKFHQQTLFSVKPEVKPKKKEIKYDYSIASLF